MSKTGLQALAATLKRAVTKRSERRLRKSCPTLRPHLETLETRMLLSFGEAAIRITTGGSRAIQEAINTALPGDIIEVAAGEYDDAQRIDVTTSGTAAKRITLRAAADARPVLPKLRFIDARHWLVSGFEIGNHEGRIGVDVRGTSSENLIFDNLVLHHMSKGVYFREGSDFEVKNSVIFEMTAGRGQDGIGVQIFRAKNVQVRDSEIYDFTGDAVHATDGPDDIYVNRGLILVDGNEIAIKRSDYRGCTENAIDVKGEFGGTVIFSNNVVYGFDRANYAACVGPTATGCGKCHAVNMNSKLDSGGSHLIATRNLIYDSNAAIDTNLWSAEIYNNVFYDLADKGIAVEADQRVEVYHNTFASMPEALGGAFADVAWVSNNVFYDAGLIRAATANNGFFGSSYSPNPPGRHPIVGAGPQDTPKFADAEAFDFQLTENSPLVNAGADLGIVLDTARRSRDPLPDVGAFEFLGRQAQSVALPVNEGFEAGASRATWSFQAEGASEVRVRKHNGPRGARHLEITRPRKSELGSAILHLDLMDGTTPIQGVTLDFWQQANLPREKSSPEPVGRVDMRGSNSEPWVVVGELIGSPEYEHYVVDLDAQAAAAGIHYTDTFQIRFAHSGARCVFGKGLRYCGPNR